VFLIYHHCSLFLFFYCYDLAILFILIYLDYMGMLKLSSTHNIRGLSVFDIGFDVHQILIDIKLKYLCKMENTFYKSLNLIQRLK
jgi:hypothetical protein